MPSHHHLPKLTEESPVLLLQLKQLFCVSATSCVLVLHPAFSAFFLNLLL